MHNVVNTLRRFVAAHAGRRITLGFVLALSLITVGFLVTFSNYNRYQQQSELVEHTLKITNRLTAVQLLLTDVETGVRGFAATGDPAFLDAYYKAFPQVEREINYIGRFTRDSLTRQQTDTLRQLARAALLVAQRQVSALRGNASTATVFALIHVSKVRMDSIRRHIGRMNARRNYVLAVRNEQAASSNRNTVVTNFLVAALTFLVLIVLYNLLDNELERRQKTENQLRAYEQELQARIRQLEASNAELERFAFVASHDMQEPLRKIQSFGGLLQDRYHAVLDEDSNRFLRKITQSAERLSKMIKDLLNFSRVSSRHDQFKPVRLTDVVERVLADHELQIQALNAHVDVGWLPVIVAVPSQMDQLFTNLISNALKFGQPTVSPEVRIRAERIDGSDVVGLIPTKPYYRITVQDNGIGFDEKYLGHIFEVFKRLHGQNTYEGTGIGLAICKRVVLQHQGHITARSQPGTGTTFEVVLPEKQLHDDYDRTNPEQTAAHITG